MPGRLAAAVVAVALGLAACGGSAPSTTTTDAMPSVAAPAGPGVLAPRGAVDRGWRVTRVVDGDTLWVSRAGQRLKVRLIGIDTPETVDPGEPVGCFGPEATAFARDLVGDRAVLLEYDDSQGREDRYGRTLAYVWLDEGPAPGPMLNEAAVRAGVAREYLYDQPYAWYPEFRSAQAEARSAGRGLWGACPDVSE